LANNIKKKLDVNEFSLAHLTLILLLHYLGKFISCSLAIYINEFNYSPSRQISSWCCLPKIIKIGQSFRELFKKQKWHVFIETQCTSTVQSIVGISVHSLSDVANKTTCHKP